MRILRLYAALEQSLAQSKCTTRLSYLLIFLPKPSKQTQDLSRRILLILEMIKLKFRKVC